MRSIQIVPLVQAWHWLGSQRKKESYPQVPKLHKIRGPPKMTIFYLRTPRSLENHGEFCASWTFFSLQITFASDITCDERACETHLAELSPASRALLLSQAGPHSTQAFTVAPTHGGVVILSVQFRVLLLRRLRLPLPLAPRLCGCHERLDTLGDHRTASATTGVLASRALPLERAVARACREAGARVSRNVRVADMNIDVPVAKSRRIEVVANGLPLWHGSQLALDATTVSPVTRSGEPHPRADTQPGWAANNATWRKRRDTYPELTRARRCCLVVIGIEVGGCFGAEAATFSRLLARQRAAAVPAHLRPAAQAALVARWAALFAVAVRALVVGDVFRRLVGRTFAQTFFAPQFQQACLLHQHGLSTRASTEALICVLASHHPIR